MDEDQIMWRIQGTDSEAVLLAAHYAVQPLARGAALAAASTTQAGQEAIMELEDFKLAETVRASAHLAVTARGHRVAEKILASRSGGKLARDALRRTLLRWLADNPKVSSTEKFVESPSAAALGFQVTDNDVENEAEFLAENNLIKGIGVAQSRHAIRPSITMEGREALDDPGTIWDFIKRGGVSQHVYNNQFEGAVAAITQGSNVNHMETHQTNVTTAERAVFSQRLAAVLEALPDDAPADLRECLTDLEASARDDAVSKPSLLARASQAFVIAASTEAGREIMQQLGHAVSVISQ
ncbi:hypothetical protein KMZ32_06010 [Phycicoccus sp. MAQZ13P-2]|uniref:hypothetical protein n=1 Tax=Phycicoccus mangrovi TaxID=2840470 RepID=UPI001C006DDC|nr:hypothetical protein [Phycicoccus mangrovi]MBT9273628.1 hypothetical protein [Phycicoccus mangrovi]